jgi:choline dehydrogenase-like flavoprotein
MAVGHLPVIEASLLPESDKKESHDVVVIGSGLSGLCAALQAQQDGADVVLEKVQNGKDGGDSKLALGGIVVPPERSQEGSEAYSQDFMKKNFPAFLRNKYWMEQTGSNLTELNCSIRRIRAVSREGYASQTWPRHRNARCTRQVVGKVSSTGQENRL